MTSGPLRHVGIRIGLVPAIVAVIVVGACQASPTTSSTSTKTLVYVTPSLANTMDPCLIPGQQTAEILQALYGTWTNYKVVSGANGALGDDTGSGETTMQPGLLSSWAVSSDQKVWTLHLQKGIRDVFGNEFKADDMRWTIDRMRHSGCSWLADAMNIKDVATQVKVVDDLTVQVTLPAPNPLFLRTLNVNNGMPVGPEARKHTTADDPWAAEWLKRNAPAIGPYKLEEWTPGVQQVLVPNPNWFGPKPSIDKIIYKEVPESSNRVAVLLSGQAQAARDLTQDQFDQVSKSSNAQTVCVAGNQFVYVALNLAPGHPTANVKVRQALAYAVPYDDIVSSAYRGRAKRLFGMVPSSYADYIGDDQYPFQTDLAKAKGLLAQAGFPKGLKTNILIDAGVPEQERIAILLQDSFGKIGVELAIDKKPTSAYLDTRLSRKFGDMVIAQDYAFILDVDYHSLVWLPNAPPPNPNFGGFIDPAFNADQSKGVSLPPGEERSNLMKDMQHIFINDLPWLSLANAPTCFAFAKNVSGYVWHTHNQVIFTDLKLG